MTIEPADGALPSHASVVVIGGGVMGCSTLYHLAKAGVSDAILLERNALASGTTWHSAAQVRALRSTQNLTNLIRYSMSLYQSLEAETGQSTGWIGKGSISIATNADRLTHIRRQEALAHLFGVEAEFISPAEAKERWPLMHADDVIGAVWSPGDGRVGPTDLCAALVKGARGRGASIHEHTAVTGIFTEGGKVTGVETSKGVIRCDAIALCTGLWSRQAAIMAGTHAPVWPCEHFYLLTRPVPGVVGNLPTLSDHDGHLYIRDDSGGLLVGCFEPLGKVIDPERLGDDFAFQLLPEDWDHFEPMMRNALHRLPCLESAEIKMLLNGPESFTPDGSFLLGESAETRGLFLGCGMNSVGIATGGGAGMALAYCIEHGHPPFDLHEADPKRFPACMSSVEALCTRVPEVLGDHYAIAYPNHQWRSARDLRYTPLHEQWRAAGAQFGQVHGYERPLHFDRHAQTAAGFARPPWFEQVGREVMQANERAAMFDQSTFGKILVEGPDAESFLDRVCTNNMRRPAGRVVYTAMLNERGGFEADLTALRLDEQRYHLYAGTTALERDLAWLMRQRNEGECVALADQTDQFAVVALAGPGAGRVAEAAGMSSITGLGYFRHTEDEVQGLWIRAARVSYVGEAGWEITCRAQDAGALYERLRSAGAEPCGSLAQTSMRIEKRFVAYGHDIDTGVTPLEAGLDFAIDWSKPFIGHGALLERRDAGVRHRLVTLVVDDENAVPLGNEPVLFNGRKVGKTSSATFGYRIGSPVALALLEVGQGATEEGARVQIDIARQLFTARVTQVPAFDPSGLRMRQ